MIKFFKNLVIFILSFDKYILYKIFKFDKWHSQIIYGESYYKDLVKNINNSNAKNIVEIGCGLGNILLNVNIKNRLGLDYSKEVLKALKFLTIIKFKKIELKKFDFINENLFGEYDIIVIINWPHTVKKNILKKKINLIFKNNLNINGFLYLDTVSDDSYRYNHDVNYLTSDNKCDILKIGSYSQGRNVWKIVKKDE